MFITVGFQLAGAILLAYGLAFRRKKEVIEQSIGYGVIIMGKVPKIIKDKWAETYLCRYGLLYTGLGYFVSLFEPSITSILSIKIISVAIMIVILVIPTMAICECQAEIRYNEISPKEVLERAKSGSMVFDDSE